MLNTKGPVGYYPFFPVFNQKGKEDEKRGCPRGAPVTYGRSVVEQ